MVRGRGGEERQLISHTSLDFDSVPRTQMSQSLFSTLTHNCCSNKI